MKIKTALKSMLLLMGVVTLFGVTLPDASALTEREYIGARQRQENFEAKYRKLYAEWLREHPRATARDKANARARIEVRRQEFIQRESQRFPEVYGYGGGYNYRTPYNQHYRKQNPNNRFGNDPYHYSSYNNSYNNGNYYNNPYGGNGSLTPFQQNSPFYEYLQNTLFNNY